MRRDLLLASAAAIDALVVLNSGVVKGALPFAIPITVSGTAAPVTTLTVASSGTSCTANPVQYTSMAAATTAVGDQYGTIYDIQVCPGTYTSTMTADFSGTIEGMGTTAQSVVDYPNSAGAQNYIAISYNNIAPAPGVTLMLKNFEIQGNVTGSPFKADRCVQQNAGTYVRYEGMDFENCQDGVVGGRWGVNYAQTGWGVVAISNTTFNNGCSISGPSHEIYIDDGYLLVGGTIAVPLSVVSGGGSALWGSLAPGSHIFGSGDTVIAAGSYSITASITDNVLNVATVASGTIYPDSTITVNGTSEIIEWQISGTPRGVGSYYVTVAGQTIAPGTSISGSYPDSLLIATAPNHFGDCLDGYSVKARTSVLSHTEGNTFLTNNSVASSGVWQVSRGATNEFINNYATFGPDTGDSDSSPLQAVQIGDTEGKKLPEHDLIANNTLLLNGVTLAFVPIPVFAVPFDTDIQVDNNVFPLASQIATQGTFGHQVLQGLGTVGAGNVYADSTPITPAVQNSYFYLFTNVLADYRGDSNPHSVTLSNNQMVWGGSGTLSATSGALEGFAAIAGPGGVTWTNGTTTNNFLWLFANAADTSANGTESTFSLAGSGNYQVWTAGTNDVINITGQAAANADNPLNVLSGTTDINISNLSVYPQGLEFTESGVSNEIVTLGTGTTEWAPGMQVSPGAVFNVTGLANNSSLNPYIEEQGTINANGITVNATTTPIVFNFSIVGGATQSYGPNPFLITTYDEIPLTAPNSMPIITLGSTTGSGSYSIVAQGGGTIYSGSNTISVIGSQRLHGPIQPPITVHMQSVQAGSSVQLQQGGPLSIYDDGPGNLQVTLNFPTSATGGAATATGYFEIDASATGTLELLVPGCCSSSWNPNSETCVLNGNSIVSHSSVGGAYIATLASGGIVKWDSQSTAPACTPI